MSRSENAEGKIQGYSLIEIREGMKMASTRLARYVKREPGKRKLEYGLALSRIAAWFLVQDPEIQKRIIQHGNAIVDELREQDEPHPPLDGEFASDVRARHKEAVVERWLQSSNMTIGEPDDVAVGRGGRRRGGKV